MTAVSRCQTERTGGGSVIVGAGRVGDARGGVKSCGIACCGGVGGPDDLDDEQMGERYYESACGADVDLGGECGCEIDLTRSNGGGEVVAMS